MDQDRKEPCPETLHTEGLFPIVDLRSKNKNFKILNNSSLTGKVCPLQMEKAGNSKKYPKKLRP